MTNAAPNVLVVDDEEFNLELISDYLEMAGINPVCANRGERALEILHAEPEKYSAILLDRMMPGIDGFEVLSRIKSDSALNQVPVIMQTAKVGKQNMLDGLKAGAHYYLTKPYDRETLTTIVKTAIRDCEKRNQLQASLHESVNTLIMMNNGKFTFKTIEQGRSLATMLANACDDSDRVVLGLTEMLINAVEHGNLGITYEEKTSLNASGSWEDEVNRRIELIENENKEVSVEFTRKENEVTFVISDKGNGFDWNQYLEISPDRAFDTHGRGIAMANSISFDRIQYLGNGNTVSVTVACWSEQ